MMLDIMSKILEGAVLAIIEKSVKGVHGYDICRRMQAELSIPDSTIYQILHKLCNKQYINFSNMVVNGRIRKVYTLSDKGVEKLCEVKDEWYLFEKRISAIF